jgi:hypothetical protein
MFLNLSQYLPPKRRYPPTEIHGVTSQNASILKMDAECPFESSVFAYGTTRCHKPKRFNPEGGCRMPLWKFGIRLRNYTLSQARTLQPWRLMQNAPLKVRYSPAELHGVTSQNATTLKMDAECPFESSVFVYGTTRCHKPERFNPEDGCRIPLWKFGIRLRNYTVSQARTLQSLRWMQNAPLKVRYPPTELHGVTSQNASTLKMDAECPFETTVSAHGTTLCHKPGSFNPEDVGWTSLWSDGIRPRNHTISQARRPQLSNHRRKKATPCVVFP